MSDKMTNRKLAALETRKKLLETAKVIIREKGLVNTSIEEITKACGVEYFDYYLLHNLNRYLYPNEVNACHLFDHRAYNSMFIQPNPYFSAELNYYKSFRSANDLAFETGDYSKETAKIGGAFDVNEALKEAVKTQSENSFQNYMD